MQPADSYNKCMIPLTLSLLKSKVSLLVFVTAKTNSPVSDIFLIIVSLHQETDSYAKSSLSLV